MKKKVTYAIIVLTLILLGYGLFRYYHTDVKADSLFPPVDSITQIYYGDYLDYGEVTTHGIYFRDQEEIRRILDSFQSATYQRQWSNHYIRNGAKVINLTVFFSDQKGNQYLNYDIDVSDKGLLYVANKKRYKVKGENPAVLFDKLNEILKAKTD